jgi:hypothetical protein
MKKNKHIGSSFDDFLKEQGIREECTAYAIRTIQAMIEADAGGDDRYTGITAEVFDHILGQAAPSTRPKENAPPGRSRWP